MSRETRFQLMLQAFTVANNIIINQGGNHFSLLSPKTRKKVQRLTDLMVDVLEEIRKEYSS